MTTALLLACPAVQGQVTARQGTPPPPQQMHFESPMILDLPFPNVTSLEAGSSLRLAEVYKYICDQHVLLRGLIVEKRYKGPRRARSLELVMAGQAFVAESYDRRIDIGLTILSGDSQIATQVLRNLKAEEKHATPFAIVVPVDEQKLRTAYAAAKQPTLQLTVTVRDDS